MSEQKTSSRMTIEQYLAFEEESSSKHEYVRGQIFAMSGVKVAHEVISVNLVAALHQHLRGSGCRAFKGDLKVYITAAECFYYPDVGVTCERLQPDGVYTQAPRLIIEVLSRSTKSIDRREKLVNYRQLPSLEQYVLIHQDRIKAEVYDKVDNDNWNITLLGSADVLILNATPDKPLRLPLSQVYEDLDLPPVVSEPDEEYETA